MALGTDKCKYQKRHQEQTMCVDIRNGIWNRPLWILEVVFVKDHIVRISEIGIRERAGRWDI